MRQRKWCCADLDNRAQDTECDIRDRTVMKVINIKGEDYVLVHTSRRAVSQPGGGVARGMARLETEDTAAKARVAKDTR